MTDSPRSISVTGTGSAEAVPDLLTVSIGVECRRETVAEAYGEAGTRSAAITAALRQTRRGQRGHVHLRAERPGRAELAGWPGPDRDRLPGLQHAHRQDPRAVRVLADPCRGGCCRRRRRPAERAEPRLRRPRRRRRPGPGGRLAGRPHHRRALRRPRRSRRWAGSCPSPSTPVSRRRSPWRRCSGQWRWTRSPSRPASRASPPRSASCGNCSADCSHCGSSCFEAPTAAATGPGAG